MLMNGHAEESQREALGRDEDDAEEDVSSSARLCGRFECRRDQITGAKTRRALVLSWQPFRLDRREQIKWPLEVGELAPTWGRLHHFVVERPRNCYYCYYYY